MIEAVPDPSFDTRGRLLLPAETAISGVTETAHASTEREAAAVIEFLKSRGIIASDGDRLVVVWSFDRITDEGPADAFNNWAATFDLLIGRIETIADRVGDRTENEQVFDRLTNARSIIADRRRSFRELAVTETGDYLTELKTEYTEFLLVAFLLLPSTTELQRLSTEELEARAATVGSRVADHLASVSDSFTPAQKMEDKSLDEFLAEIEESAERAEDESLDEVVTEIEEPAERTDIPCDETGGDNTDI